MQWRGGVMPSHYSSLYQLTPEEEEEIRKNTALFGADEGNRLLQQFIAIKEMQRKAAGSQAIQSIGERSGQSRALMREHDILQKRLDQPSPEEQQRISKMGPGLEEHMKMLKEKATPYEQIVEEEVYQKGFGTQPEVKQYLQSQEDIRKQEEQQRSAERAQAGVSQFTEKHIEDPFMKDFVNMLGNIGSSDEAVNQIIEIIKTDRARKAKEDEQEDILERKRLEGKQAMQRTRYTTEAQLRKTEMTKSKKDIESQKELERQIKPYLLFVEGVETYGPLAHWPQQAWANFQGMLNIDNPRQDLGKYNKRLMSVLAKTIGKDAGNLAEQEQKWKISYLIQGTETSGLARLKKKYLSLLVDPNVSNEQLMEEYTKALVEYGGKRYIKEGQENPTISTDEEYDRLPSGTIFIGPDGIKRRKP